MHYLHSGYKTFTSLRQGKQRDLQLGDDPGAFPFVNATNSDKLGTFGNLNVKSDCLIDDVALESVGLPLQSMKSKTKPCLLLPSFDKAKTSAEVVMASQALEVLVSDENWIETLYRESEDIFSDAIDPLPATKDLNQQPELMLSFKRSQAPQWSTRFRDFLEFKKEHGHTGMFLSIG
jgi:hypothetical protein